MKTWLAFVLFPFAISLRVWYVQSRMMKGIEMKSDGQKASNQFHLPEVEIESRSIVSDWKIHFRKGEWKRTDSSKVEGEEIDERLGTLPNAVISVFGMSGSGRTFVSQLFRGHSKFKTLKNDKIGIYCREVNGRLNVILDPFEPVIDLSSVAHKSNIGTICEDMKMLRLLWEKIFSRIGDVIIFVIKNGNIIQTDQEFIGKLQQIKKTVFVCHNLPGVRNQEELMATAESTRVLMNGHVINGDKMEYPPFFRSCGFHFFLVDENTTFGEKFNQLSIQNILNQIGFLPLNDHHGVFGRLQFVMNEEFQKYFCYQSYYDVRFNSNKEISGYDIVKISRDGKNPEPVTNYLYYDGLYQQGDYFPFQFYIRSEENETHCLFIFHSEELEYVDNDDKQDTPLPDNAFTVYVDENGDVVIENTYKPAVNFVRDGKNRRNIVVEKQIPASPITKISVPKGYTTDDWDCQFDSDTKLATISLPKKETRKKRNN
eukprot:TRINITY_DN13994_c0_g1_i1.p1 TRINITY_DN13994_c0_g1~~TRINITY_DN13994_c0_g1_i1.p1  ORF type:complete len:485 (-),score=134.84 TRINITY_DN13994_c0_g1_i1:64-1518(-)